MAGFDDGKNLIFIGGAPRSGTTMVQNMVSNHPEIAGGPEFDHVPDIVQLRNLLHRAIDRGRIDFFCNKQHVDQAIGRLIEDLLLPCAKKQNAHFLCEKTPTNVLAMEKLLEIFPKAKFIFCIRDPRAVVSSILEVGKRAKRKNTNTGFYTRNIFGAMHYVKTCNDAGFEVANQNDRVHILKYEEMVNDSVAKGRQICEFLQIEWNQSMLNAIKDNGGEWKSTADGIWYTSGMLNKVPDPSRQDKWRENLTRVQVGLIENFFKKDENLQSIGYVLSSTSSLVFCLYPFFKVLKYVNGFLFRKKIKKLNKYRYA